MWASEHRGLHCWFFCCVLFHFFAGSTPSPETCVLRLWLLQNCWLSTPLGSHIFPRHTAPVSLSPTPVSPPRLLRTTAFATHHRVGHTRPRVVVTGPVSPSRLLHTMPRRQRHRKQMCNAMCPPGCATVWCPHDDAVVVHTTRWRGLKSPPCDFHITRRVLDLISRQNFLSDYRSSLFAGLSPL